MRSKAIVFTERFKVTVDQFDVPASAEGQIITRTLFSGVSTGTETRVLSGKQVGGTFPLIPGYENVGQIVEVGPGVKLKPGAIVFVGSSNFTGKFVKCWGAHLQYALKDAASVIPVPKGTRPLDALYTKVAAIALHGVKRARVGPEDGVAVIGLGLIGHLALQCCKAKGAKVIGVDTDAQRLEIASRAGADFVINAASENVEARVKEISDGGVDVAIDVTGVAKTVDATARLVHGKPWAPPYPPSARVVILGSYIDPIHFAYQPTLFDNEPDIFPSRDTTPDDLKDAMKLIAGGKVKPEIIPAKQFHFEDAPGAYKELLDSKLMRMVFSWS